MHSAVEQRSQEAQIRAWVLIVLLIWSFLLQVSGFIAPGWIVFSESDSEGDSAMIHIGLWFYTVCMEGVGCEIGSTSSLTSYKDLSASQHMAGSLLTEYKAETATALFCCVVAFTCAVTSRTAVNRLATYGATTFFALIAGILSLVASVKVLDGILQAGKLFRLIGETNPFDPPYALIQTMVGGCLYCITALFGLWYVYRSAQAHPQPQFAVQQQGQVLSTPQYAYANPMTPTDPTAVTNSMPSVPTVYPGANGGYVFEKAIGQ